LIIGFIVGINWDIIGVAISYVIVTYILAIPNLWYSFKETPVKIYNFYESTILSICSSIIMASILIFISRKFQPFVDYCNLFLHFIIGILLYCIVFICLPKGKYEFMQNVSYILHIWKKDK
jgi:hypothetical protein